MLRWRFLLPVSLAALLLASPVLAVAPVHLPLVWKVDPDLVCVVRVVDGDTIDVQVGPTLRRVRYIGIDTPETGDCYAAQATAANVALVEGRLVRLVKDVSETDRYGRLLRYVYQGELFVNAEMVRQGYALVWTYPPDVAHADLFASLQREAREANRGLWGSCAMPAPSDAPTPTATPTTTPTPDGCCRHCGPSSQPCGNSCISLAYNCHQPPGCACP